MQFSFSYIVDLFVSRESWSKNYIYKQNILLEKIKQNHNLLS